MLTQDFMSREWFFTERTRYVFCEPIFILIKGPDSDESQRHYDHHRGHGDTPNTG